MITYAKDEPGVNSVPGICCLVCYCGIIRTTTVCSSNSLFESIRTEMIYIRKEMKRCGDTTGVHYLTFSWHAMGTAVTYRDKPRDAAGSAPAYRGSPRDLPRHAAEVVPRSRSAARPTTSACYDTALNEDLNTPRHVTVRPAVTTAHHGKTHGNTLGKLRG